MKRFKKWLKLNDINYKKYLIVLYVLLVMVPVMFIVNANNHGENSLIKTVACITLLVFFVIFCIYDSRKKLASDWGIIDVTTEKNLFDEAKKELSIAKEIKITASEELDDVLALLSDSSVPNDCTIKLLLLDGNSKFADYLEDKEKYIADLARLEGFVNEHTNIEIKYYNLIPLDTLVIINDDTFTSPRTQRLADGRRIMRHYAGNKLGTRQFNDVFNRAWEHPTYEGREETDNA